MYFLFQISMYQGAKIAFKNAPLLGVFQSGKTCNLWVLLIRSESALLWQYFYRFVLLLR